ncbi:MAG: HipA N-terminal domain-containing protein [Bacteroidetes bacterium]|jgi:serine/threonine-protein kinase HipA|nr:HipA N-terminal domain-containing protein [Bacteroidota bacterium]MBK7566571.1 HipA N-terminal domain-containing protein [Bacteroidota bacterium]MBP8916079.1 HipA N-terminal domain-containing protein [Chitinophagales bacterium]MBP9796982.1 HipA N-terminal domain-containing protein [Chitinophagales bacterium]
MRSAKIFFKEEEAGVLTQFDDGNFSFMYNRFWLADDSKPGISLTLPKREEEYRSKFLFPFFYNMLPEGNNKYIVCKHHRIDNDDHFGLLMITAKYDSIGAVSVIKIKE